MLLADDGTDLASSKGHSVKYNNTTHGWHLQATVGLLGDQVELSDTISNRGLKVKDPPRILLATTRRSSPIIPTTGQHSA